MFIDGLKKISLLKGHRHLPYCKSLSISVCSESCAPFPFLQDTRRLGKEQPETLGLPSLIRQALDQLGLRESSDPSIHVVKSGVLAAIVQWSDFSVLQVRSQFTSCVYILFMSSSMSAPLRIFFIPLATESSIY